MIKNFSIAILSFCIVSCNLNKAKEKPDQNPNTFYHTLLYQFSEATTEVEKEDFFELFLGLPQKIKSLKAVNIYHIESSSEQYHVLITLDFLGKSGLVDYENHPDHNRINEMGARIINDYAYFRYPIQ